VYRKTAGLVLLPAGVVTTTWAGPAAWGGVVAVIWVDEFTVKLVAGVPPKVTAVAPVNAVPMIVTAVPPLVGPMVGWIDAIAGTWGAWYTK
jgi:hypothetical protein